MSGALGQFDPVFNQKFGTLGHVQFRGFEFDFYWGFFERFTARSSGSLCFLWLNRFHSKRLPEALSEFGHGFFKHRFVHCFKELLCHFDRRQFMRVTFVFLWLEKIVHLYVVLQNYLNVTTRHPKRLVSSPPTTLRLKKVTPPLFSNLDLKKQSKTKLGGGSFF